MCFGNKKETASKTTSVPAWLEGASQRNIGELESIRNNGYTSYTGPRVAGLSNDEQSGNSLIRALAGSSNPYSSNLQQVYGNVANQGPQSVSTVRAIDNVPGAPGTAAGSTQDYMDPYVAAVLAPQLREIDEAANRANLSTNREATMAGAFGDARHGVRDSLTERDRLNTRVDTTGRTYSQAFNNAMALKTGDINRLLQADTTNANFAEQGLLRALQGGQALQNLDKYDTGRTADLAGLLQKQGAGERAIDQGKLDADYAEFQRSQNFPIEISKIIASAINGTPYSKTETQYQNDYGGFGMLGALGGSLLQAGLPLLFSDRRVKENIRLVGKTFDGQPIYTFTYIGDPMGRVHMGLMAQEVETVAPEAVVEVGGVKMVDYAKATARAAAMQVH